MSGKRARMAFAFAAVAIPLTEATDFPDPISTISIKNAFSVQRSCPKTVPVAVFMAEIAVICANTVGNFPEPAIRNNAETLAFIPRLPHVKRELIIVRSVPNHPSATVITVRNAKTDNDNGVCHKKGKGTTPAVDTSCADGVPACTTSGCATKCCPSHGGDTCSSCHKEWGQGQYWYMCDSCSSGTKMKIGSN